LLYTDDLFVIAETEDDLIKRLNQWKDFVENRGIRVNMISGEWQKVTQKAVRWPYGVRDGGVVILQYTVLVVRSGYTGNVVVS